MADRIRIGMVGGGQGAFIGAVHRIALRMDDRFDLVAVAAILPVMLAVQWGLRETSLEQQVARWPRWLHAAWLAALWLTLALAPSTDRAFIYFQF